MYLQINRETKDNARKGIVKRSFRGSYTHIAEAIIDTTKTDEEKFADMIRQLENSHDISEKKSSAGFDSTAGYYLISSSRLLPFNLINEITKTCWTSVNCFFHY